MSANPVHKPQKENEDKIQVNKTIEVIAVALALDQRTAKVWLTADGLHNFPASRCVAPPFDIRRWLHADVAFFRTERQECGDRNLEH